MSVHLSSSRNDTLSKFRLSHELGQFQKKAAEPKPRFHRRAAYLPTSLGNRQSTEGKSNDPGH